MKGRSSPVVCHLLLRRPSLTLGWLTARFRVSLARSSLQADVVHVKYDASRTTISHNNCCIYYEVWRCITNQLGLHARIHPQDASSSSRCISQCTSLIYMCILHELYYAFPSTQSRHINNSLIPQMPWCPSFPVIKRLS